MPDPYEVLQVDPRAEPEVLRAAYRVLARKYHPDHGGDARRMIEINDAWDVLGDPARRAAYDASRAKQAAAAAAAAAESARRPAYTAPPSTSPAYSAPSQSEFHAGRPPGHPSGTVLDFGRYSGWSLGEIARHDTDYLEWLQRSTLGRRLRAEIDALLAQRRRPGAAPTSTGGAWRGHR